jgi:predicted nucleic acid-binding protein
MILADTSVWVDHFRRGNPALARALEEGEILTHPFAIGELACGNLTGRTEIVDLLRALPAAVPAAHDEVLAFVQRERLFGRGIGWVDAHLLASAALSDASLWTLDRALARAVAALGLSPSLPRR